MRMQYPSMGPFILPHNKIRLRRNHRFVVITNKQQQNNILIDFR